jgi:hypothetical protein
LTASINTRAVFDGLTVPPIKGGTGKNFADRVSLFVGSAYHSLFEQLYALRGKIEHLHENRYLETYDRTVRLALLKDAGILEYIVRSCIVRVLDTPALWSYFSNTSAVESFWTLPEPQRQSIWGPPIDPMQALSGFNENWVRDIDLGAYPPNVGPRFLHGSLGACAVKPICIFEFSVTGPEKNILG